MMLSIPTALALSFFVCVWAYSLAYATTRDAYR
jgi:hypothetical protein